MGSISYVESIPVVIKNFESSCVGLFGYLSFSEEGRYIAAGVI